jgi:CBS domain-containing protein
VRVENILKVKGADIISAKSDDSVSETAILLTKMKIGALLVRDAGGGPGPGIAGIISERDIIAGLAVHGADVLNQPVSKLMTRDVHVCSPDDTVDHIMSMMSSRRIRHLPVVKDDELVGMISIGDIVKQRIAETEEEAQALREYITS